MKNDMNGVFVPAGILIGIGVGFLIDEIAAGTLIGLGVGFLLMGVAETLTKPETKE